MGQVSVWSDKAGIDIQYLKPSIQLICTNFSHRKPCSIFPYVSLPSVLSTYRHCHPYPSHTPPIPLLRPFYSPSIPLSSTPFLYYSSIQSFPHLFYSRSIPVPYPFALIPLPHTPLIPLPFPFHPPYAFALSSLLPPYPTPPIQHHLTTQPPINKKPTTTPPTLPTDSTRSRSRSRSPSPPTQYHYHNHPPPPKIIPHNQQMNLERAETTSGDILSHQF